MWGGSKKPMKPMCGFVASLPIFMLHTDMYHSVNLFISSNNDCDEFIESIPHWYIDYVKNKNWKTGQKKRKNPPTISTVCIFHRWVFPVYQAIDILETVPKCWHCIILSRQYIPRTADKSPAGGMPVSSQFCPLGNCVFIVLPGHCHAWGARVGS